MPVLLRTSTWSNAHCPNDHLVSLQPVFSSRLPPGSAVNESSLQCNILFYVPMKVGSPFLQYARHLTDFIHLSLSLFISIFPSSRWINCLFLFVFFYDIKLRCWATVYLKVHLLKWKQYTYYCCFTFQCMASRVTAHRHTKKYTYPSEWQAAQQSVRKWCRIKSWCLINCKYVFVHYWQILISTDRDIGAN